MTVAQLFTKYMRRYDGRPSAETNRYLAANVVATIGTVRLDRLKSGTVRRYRQERNSAGSAPSSRNREVGLLRTLMRLAHEDGHVRTLPTRWHHEAEKPRQRVLSRQEARELLEDLPPGWHRDVVTVLLFCGARVGEILGTRWEHVMQSRRMVVVPSPKEGEGKVVVIGADAEEACRRLWARDSDRPFGRPGRTPEQDYQALRYHFRQRDVTIHDLRRTFGSWAIRAGCSLEQVSQALGHKDPKTTRRTYARIDEVTRQVVADSVRL